MIATTVSALKEQYRRLCVLVNDANPYFWDALVDEGEEANLPSYYSLGSKEEADPVLHQCKRAWQESEDAILMIAADTSSFVPVYKGPTADPGAGGLQSVDLGQRARDLDKRRGTGDAFPSRFKPPQSTSSPAELFPVTHMDRGRSSRFVSGNDPKKVLVYADGACVNNGQAEPRAGWAVIVATSNRAELRAAIAVLRLCDWRSEGFDTVVIATDSAYVVDGATGWVKGWVRNGWKTRIGDVKNKDLWELLLGEVERWNGRGLRVAFWAIPRELNTYADGAAKEAAQKRTTEAEFRDVMIEPPWLTTTATNTGAGPGTHILALCLENEALFDDVFGNLVSQVTSKAKMERAATPETALNMLSQEPPPSVILVVDGALTRRRKVWERVIDNLREGATVVLAGSFSSMVNQGEFNRFFTRLGLPWRQGSYHRATVTLRRNAVGCHLASRLPSAYSQKALFVANVDKSAAWYTEAETSNEAAVAFAKVGSGRLCYVGDVNGEEGSDAVVLAMCGLLH
ncbi:Ribonuclease H [Madurella mycetomatis]|uniref:ribonuclease H n=1 Tax=Madurella mycetomatis TaxID=100816 RepID=A0A175VW01_9PEZI|nr:Ribonuclease H [Madurella mycetomatis]